VESVLGRIRFILFYLICGIAATLAFVVTEPGSTAPLIGASGAIAGVMGAYLLLFPNAKVLTLFFIILYPVLVWVPALLILVLWLFIQFINVGGAGETGVAWAAHIGGFFSGMIALKILRPKKPPPKPPPRRPQPPIRVTRPDRGYFH
jgi:membrane associated rhomboid family serine protease